MYLISQKLDNIIYKLLIYSSNRFTKIFDLKSLIVIIIIIGFFLYSLLFLINYNFFNTLMIAIFTQSLDTNRK